MRRITAITLLFLFLLNIIGYYGVFLGLKYTLGQKVVEDLDSESFSAGDLVEFEIPVTLPYMPDQANYERVDGLIEVEGKYYRLVKQKYAGDTLFIVCLPDHDQQKIHKAIEEYVSTFTAPDASQSKTVDFSKSLSKDYLPTLVTLEDVSKAGFYETGTKSYVASSYSAYLSILSPPPKEFSV